jgi:hypothetical protein
MKTNTIEIRAASLYFIEGRQKYKNPRQTNPENLNNPNNPRMIERFSFDQEFG